MISLHSVLYQKSRSQSTQFIGIQKVQVSIPSPETVACPYGLAIGVPLA